MREFLHILFLPHQNNQFKAKALHPSFFASYILFLVVPFLIFWLLLVTKPGILGITAFFDPGQVVAKTNLVRQKVGVSQLAVNPKLSQAAQAKAEDMASKGYWAHFAPDGKMPWDFIRESGYNFQAAGENLARDFDNIDQMVAAWVNSPSHAENLLSSNFSDIGIGVAEGVISGKKTTVVVQMFGKKAIIPVAKVQPEPLKIQTTLEGQPLSQPQVGTPRAGSQQIAKSQNIINVEKLVEPQVFNIFTPSKIATLALIVFVSFLILTDFVYVKFAKLARPGPHPLFHLTIFVIILFAIWYSNSGLIL